MSTEQANTADPFADEYEDLRRAGDAATPAPWRAEGCEIYAEGDNGRPERIGESGDTDQDHLNVAYIVAAVNALPGLLAERDDAMATVGRLRAELADVAFEREWLLCEADDDTRTRFHRARNGTLADRRAKATPEQPAATDEPRTADPVLLDRLDNPVPDCDGDIADGRRCPLHNPS